MRDPLGRYREAAHELTHATKSAADKLVGGLLRRGGSATGNAQELVDELRERSQENRDAVAAMVRAETRRVVNAMGLATAADVERLERELAQLRRELREQGSRSGASGTAAGAAARTSSRTPRSTAGTLEREKERGTRQTSKKTAARKTARKVADADLPTPELGEREAPRAVDPVDPPAPQPTRAAAEGASPDSAEERLPGNDGG